MLRKILLAVLLVSVTVSAVSIDSDTTFFEVGDSVLDLDFRVSSDQYPVSVLIEPDPEIADFVEGDLEFELSEGSSRDVSLAILPQLSPGVHELRVFAREKEGDSFVRASETFFRVVKYSPDALASIGSEFRNPDKIVVTVTNVGESLLDDELELSGIASRDISLRSGESKSFEFTVPLGQHELLMSVDGAVKLARHRVGVPVLELVKAEQVENGFFVLLDLDWNQPLQSTLIFSDNGEMREVKSTLRPGRNTVRVNIKRDSADFATRLAVQTPIKTFHFDVRVEKGISLGLPGGFWYDALLILLVLAAAGALAAVMYHFSRVKPKVHLPHLKFPALPKLPKLSLRRRPKSVVEECEDLLARYERLHKKRK